MRFFWAAAAVLLAVSTAVGAQGSGFQVRFETGGTSPKLNSATPVTVVIEKQGPPGSAEEETVILSVRVPAGIKLSGEKWVPLNLPPEFGEESEEQVWTLFDWDGPVIWSKEGAGGNEISVARIPVFFEVTEEGFNWIITARVRPAGGDLSQGATGAILATVHGEMAVFHSAPFKNPLPYENNPPAKKNAQKNGS